MMLVMLPAFAADVTGSLDTRVVQSLLTDFPVDAEGTTHGQTSVGDLRVRTGLNATLDTVLLKFEADFFTGQAWGEPWGIATDIDERHRDTVGVLNQDAFVPRELSLNTRLGDAGLQVGLTTSQWGLGLLSNNGAGDPLFGRTDFGDRVVRVATQLPASELWSVGLGGDMVVEDDSAIAADGQQAYQVFVAAQRVEGERELGVYAVNRNQREPSELTTQLGVLDVFVRVPVALGDWTLHLAGEGAGIVGRTDRATTYDAPDDQPVRTAGAVAQVALEAPSLVTAHLRGGLASGDDATDDKATGFTFDRDYDVGMVLFDEVLAGVDAATYALVDDPANAGQAPNGADGLVKEGAFGQAAYVQPAVQLEPVDGLDVRVGAMAAWATAPISQAFYTARNGGVPTTHHETASTGRFLGTELDWALGYERSLKDWTPGVRVQGGHLFASADVAGDGPDRIDLYSVAVRVQR